MMVKAAENAETFLRNLKYQMKYVWEQFGEDSPLERLVYAKDHYGVMQREELKDILNAFTDLKKKIDSLLTECAAIPPDQGISHSDSRQLQTDEEDDRFY